MGYGDKYLINSHVKNFFFRNEFLCRLSWSVYRNTFSDDEIIKLYSNPPMIKEFLIFFEEFWKNTFLNKIIRIQSENVKEGFFEKRDFCDLWKFSLCNLDFFKHKIFADFKNKSAIWQIIVLRRNSQNRNCFHAMFNAKFE